MSGQTATQFHALHQTGLLMLANAWDAGSARLVESLGAKAIATSSAAVAWAHGYPDGDLLPKNLLIATTAAITRIIAVPLTVDMESGYADEPAQVADLASALIDAGAAGINIEDGAASPDLLCRKIEAVRRTAEARGINLFINARTDVYLRGLAADNSAGETLNRAKRYQEAGASGLFVPGVTLSDEIKALAAGSALPLNVMLRPTLPPASELALLGVRRLSAGSGISQATYAFVRAQAQEFLQTGQIADTAFGTMMYGDLNQLMVQK